jgi:predicted nucleic acid-binding protein
LSGFDAFCQQAAVFPITDAVLDRCADLGVTARQGGFSGADADLLIAATAVTPSRTLVTGSTAHFAWIANLRLENWRFANRIP